MVITYLDNGLAKKYWVTLLLLCIYNHRTTKTNQKYPSVNL